MNDDFIKFIELTKRQKLLKEELKEVTVEITGMHEDLIDDMAEHGVENFKTPHGETIYIHTRTSAIPRVSKNEACGALKLSGHGDLVDLNFHAGSVSSLMKELEDKGELDDTLLEAFTIHKIMTVRVRGIKLH